MRRWSELAERVAATTRTSEKTRLIADYLPALPPDELGPAVRFLAGRPGTGDGARTGIGWSTIAAVVQDAAGVAPDALRAAYDRSSDLGTAVGEVIAAARGHGEAGARGTQRGHVAGAAGTPPTAGTPPAAGTLPEAPAVPPPVAGTPPEAPAEDGPSVGEAAAVFAAIGAASGPVRKGRLLADLLARVDPLSAKYLVRVLTGDLRIGLREGLLEGAIAAAFGRPLADVKWAGMLTGDVGTTALLAREGRLADARLTLFRPLTAMLASPAEDAAEILARLGPTVWVEDKYDGIRAQLHRRGDEVRLYSRDLHDVSAGFPELVAAAGDLAWDGILDGEILAFRAGTVLPFLALQGRLGRKRPPPEVLAAVPVRYVAFDALALGPRGGSVKPLLREPLAERRRRLEALGLPEATASRLALSTLVRATSADELEAAFVAARARRNEGLLVKDPASGYSPGRRGLGWLKMKKALATIDCVVVGVEAGHGKRHGVLSDYTFAVRDDATGDLVTIGKAYSGLTDAEIGRMTAWFEDHTIERHGRYRRVEPSVVVEIAFDVIMRSSRHRSGFALRFPRIARLRPDKDPREIDTLATVEALFTGLQHGAEHLVTAASRDGRGQGPGPGA